MISRAQRLLKAEAVEYASVMLFFHIRAFLGWVIFYHETFGIGGHPLSNYAKGRGEGGLKMRKNA